MISALVRARPERAALFALVLLTALVLMTTPAGAAVVENPPDDGTEWPVLDTRPPADGESLPAAPAVVTRAQLATAGQTTVAASPALAGGDILIVDDDRAQCPNADFTTSSGLELAVQAAPAGARIRVCPGVYLPVTIDKPLYVQGPLHSGQATQCQTAPVANPAEHAVITGSRSSALVDIVSGGVTFEGIVVQDNPDGPGLRTAATGSGYVIRHNVVQRNRNGVDFNTSGMLESWFLFNCVRSNGSIFAGTGGTGVLTTGGVVNARVEENYVTGHECGSISFTGPLGCLALPGPLPRVSDVTISHNDVIDDSAIGVASATNVTITYNEVRLLFGAAVVVSGFGTTIRDVDVSFNHIDGQNAIVTQGIFITPSGPTIGTDIQVRANLVENVADVPTLARGHGIVIRSRRTEVHENHVENNRGNGIEIRGGTTNLIHGNLVVANGVPTGDITDGIRIRPGATGNVVENNRLRDNTTHDCHDSNPNGANVWRHNVGYTENQPGLCVRPPAP